MQNSKIKYYLYFKRFLNHYFIITKFLIFFSLVTLELNCGNSISFENKKPLKRAPKIYVELTDMSKIKLSYQIENEESNFIGYNLYLSRTTISDSEIKKSLPYLCQASIPTFSHEPNNSKNKQKIQKIIHNESCNPKIKLLYGQEYFLRITAVSRLGKESLPSPEASIIIQ